MICKPITDGSISGTGTIKVSNGIIGGVVISTDGTNAATVVLQTTNSAGRKVFHMVTKQPFAVTMPIHLGSRTLYYSITGTGATAQFYEGSLSDR